MLASLCAAALLTLPASSEPDAGGASLECQIIRVLPDGRLRVLLGGKEQNAALAGLQSAPPRVRFIQLVAQLADKPRKPARCAIVSKEPLQLSVLAYGWQDKSGDVWFDLASLLIDERAAQADPSAPWAVDRERKAAARR